MNLNLISSTVSFFCLLFFGVCKNTEIKLVNMLEIEVCSAHSVRMEQATSARVCVHTLYSLMPACKAEKCATLTLPFWGRR